MNIKQDFSTLLSKMIQSRKFWLAFGIMIFSCIALWLGKLDASDWKGIVEWALGGYLLSQGGVDAAEKISIAKGIPNVQG